MAEKEKALKARNLDQPPASCMAFLHHGPCNCMNVTNDPKVKSQFQIQTSEDMP